MSHKRVLACIIVFCFALSIVPLQLAKAPYSSSQTATTSVDDVDPWPMFHHDLNHTGYSTSDAPNTNQTLWNYTTGSVVRSSSAVSGGIVYVGSVDSRVYALNASSGVQLWNYTTGSVVESSPAVSGGIVYVGSDDCRVYALNASTGALIWNYTTGSAVWSSPAVSGGIVYVGSNDHKVYAFGPVHDVAVTDVTSCKDGCNPFPTVGQKYTMHINVTVENQGDITEDFNVTIYANTTVINQTQLVLPSATSTTFSFKWNATLAYGNYTISAVADIVPSETDVADNTHVGCTVLVTIPGDVDGDFRVRPMDLNTLLAAYGSRPYNPNCDIDDSHKVGPIDLNTLLSHYGQHYP